MKVCVINIWTIFFTGNILGATELRGPEPYRYKDLKAATKDFSDETKLGEGGFGDVYKVNNKDHT